MRTEFLCVSVLRVASGPRVKLVSCKSALNPPVVYSTDRSKAVVPVLVLLFVALWFILRGDLLYVFSCVILVLCFIVLLVLWLPRLGKRELILVLFVRLFDLCLFWFVGFLFLLGSGKGCDLWLWHSLDFSLTFFFIFIPLEPGHSSSYLLRGDLFYVLPCVILFLCVCVCVCVCVWFFSPFSIAITSLGEERANLYAFRTFVRFMPVWFCTCLVPVLVLLFVACGLFYEAIFCMSFHVSFCSCVL